LKEFNEQEYTKIVITFIKIHFPDAEIECMYQGLSEMYIFVDHEHYRGVENFVLWDSPRVYKNFRKDLDQRFGYYHFTVRESIPKIFPAKIGEFVHIYQEFDLAFQDVSNVGIVTSIHITQDGDTLYGCRIISPVINSSYLRQDNRSYDIIIEEETFHDGFLRIFTSKELKDILYQKADEQLEKLIEDVKLDYKSLKKTLPKVLSCLKDFTQVKRSTVEASVWDGEKLTDISRCKCDDC